MFAQCTLPGPQPCWGLNLAARKCCCFSDSSTCSVLRAKWEACRGVRRRLSAQQPLLREACSLTGMAAQLTRLFGVAAALDNEHTYAAVLRAAGSLCDFGSERRAECLTAMADVGAAPEGLLRKTVNELLHCGLAALTDDGLAEAALEVALTLLEAAAHLDPFEPQEEGQDQPPEVGGDDPLHVVNSGWLNPDRNWALTMAASVVLVDVQTDALVLGLDASNSANLRRMAVASSTFRCACRALAAHSDM